MRSCRAGVAPVDSANRPGRVHRVFVADLLSEHAGLGKTKMVPVGRRTAAHDAGLAKHESGMLLTQLRLEAVFDELRIGGQRMTKVQTLPFSGRCKFGSGSDPSFPFEIPTPT